MLEEEGEGGRRYVVQSMSSGRCSVILCINEVIVSISWGPSGRQTTGQMHGGCHRVGGAYREDEHGRVITRLCKDTRGREGYVGNSG